MVKNATTLLLELHSTWEFLIFLEEVLNNQQSANNQQCMIIYLSVSNCSTVFDHFDILASYIKNFLLLITESLFIKRDHCQ